MKCREFNPKTDAKRVDDFTKGNAYGLDISRDIIILSEVGGKALTTPVIVGVAAGQQATYVHHFIIRAGLHDRIAAESLLAYAQGILKGRGERKMIFCVAPDNKEMMAFMEAHDADRLPDGIYYELEVK